MCCTIFQKKPLNLFFFTYSTNKLLLKNSQPPKDSSMFMRMSCSGSAGKSSYNLGNNTCEVTLSPFPSLSSRTSSHSLRTNPSKTNNVVVDRLHFDDDKIEEIETESFLPPDRRPPQPPCTLTLPAVSQLPAVYALTVEPTRAAFTIDGGISKLAKKVYFLYANFFLQDTR